MISLGVTVSAASMIDLILIVYFPAQFGTFFVGQFLYINTVTEAGKQAASTTILIINLVYFGSVGIVQLQMSPHLSICLVSAQVLVYLIYLMIQKQRGRLRSMSGVAAGNSSLVC